MNLNLWNKIVHFFQRYLFLRGLIDHERSQRSRHYLKSAAECTSRAIVSLELADNPITSVAEARKLEGVGKKKKLGSCFQVPWLPHAHYAIIWLNYAFSYYKKKPSWKKYIKIQTCSHNLTKSLWFVFFQIV